MVNWLFSYSTSSLNFLWYNSSMTESEQGQVQLEQDVEYLVNKTIFNATVLHPLPHPVEASPYMRDMGNIHLEEGDEVSFAGTAGELKLYGDVISETPLFKPGQEIRKRHEFIVESDLLAVNPLAIDRLKRKTDESNDRIAVIMHRPGGEPEEIERASKMIDRGNELKTQYESMEKDDLEKEYSRIYSDDDLSLQLKDNLSAILSVLVSKYHIGNEELKKLRE